MRPVFIIYIAAGITFLFALLNGVASCGQAYVAQHSIIALKLQGDELEKATAAREGYLDSAAAAFVLALFQSVILIFAKKLSRQNRVV
jgi:hypothetical protein